MPQLPLSLGTSLLTHTEDSSLGRNALTSHFGVVLSGLVLASYVFDELPSPKDVWRQKTNVTINGIVSKIGRVAIFAFC